MSLQIIDPFDIHSNSPGLLTVTGGHRFIDAHSNQEVYLKFKLTEFPNKCHLTYFILYTMKTQKGHDLKCLNFKHIATRRFYVSLSRLNRQNCVRMVYARYLFVFVCLFI